MIIVVRMRGEVGTRHDVKATFNMLGMKKLYSFKLLENTPSNMGMVKKINSFAAWGEATDEIQKMLKGRRGLKTPRGGVRSKKLHYPKGVLGHNEKIAEMIKKMS
ncbi:MAG TPA: uL30 family ribosomal protein [archaeon]|nr:uL30 family ribosomal protein [archaeon]